MASQARGQQHYDIRSSPTDQNEISQAIGLHRPDTRAESPLTLRFKSALNDRTLVCIKSVLSTSKPAINVAHQVSEAGKQNCFMRKVMRTGMSECENTSASPANGRSLDHSAYL